MRGKGCGATKRVTSQLTSETASWLVASSSTRLNASCAHPGHSIGASLKNQAAAPSPKVANRIAPAYNGSAWARAARAQASHSGACTPKACSSSTRPAPIR